MKNFYYCSIFIILSCTHQKTIKYNLFDMENTIAAGSKLELNDNVVIKHNSIIAFRVKNSTEVTVLRVVGCPGDTVEISNGQIYVNNKLMEKPLSSKKIYTVYLKNPSGFKKLEHYKFSVYSANYSMFSLSKDEYNEILRMKIVDSIYTLPVDSNQVQVGVLKNKFSKYSNSYYFGPVLIPTKDHIIDDEILSITPQYLSPSDLGKKISDKYYFCIGDNFPEAKDSRFIGLIPESSIIGVVDKIQNVKSINVTN